MAKKEGIKKLFDNIASDYDRLNHILSLNIDKGWRKKAVKRLGIYAPQNVLDIATGTGDFALLTAKLIQPESIIGADISEGMMEVARRKVEEQKSKLGSTKITFQKEDCLKLSFPDSSFDAVTVAYHRYGCRQCAVGYDLGCFACNF